MKTEDICRLCGDVREMTFEHIPPRRSFNKSSVLLETVEAHRIKFRRGLGRQSLCETCNGKSGALYGEAFFRWSAQALESQSILTTSNSFSLPFLIRPLYVLKQISVMCLAMLEASCLSVEHFVDLRKFVMHPREQHFPARLRIACYFSRDGHPRFSPTAITLNTMTGQTSMTFSEVALPPMGYCLLNNEAGEQEFLKKNEMCDLTWFSRYAPDELDRVHLKLARRTPIGPFPGRYIEQDK